MAERFGSGLERLDRSRVEASLFSSSTKHRISTLNAVHLQLERHELSVDDVSALLVLLFETYPLYIDHRSREAAQRCLRAVAAGPEALSLLSGLVASLKLEAHKSGIAPANAFVLVEWFAVLLAEFANRQELWHLWGSELIAADALALEMCLGSSPKLGLKHSALVVTRRALRRVFKSEALGPTTVQTVVSRLTAKGPATTAKNAVLLGVIAGVSIRLPSVRPLFEEVKRDCYVFYAREILGSRTTLPRHIANALHDLFEAFTNADDLRKDLVPAIEKALLRSPEVVLNHLVAPMVTSLDQKLDLSEFLGKNLLKPLLANVKSTNASIRSGALRTFEACAQKSNTGSTIEMIAEEILNPLKQNKVTAPEQRVLLAQMLRALISSATVAKKITASLSLVALKETNEAAIEAETSAVVKHALHLLGSGTTLDSTVVDAFAKGLADKKPSVRKIWAIQACTIFWNLPSDKLETHGTVALAQSVFSRMSDNIVEANANPLPAAQNGLATLSCALAAAALSKFRSSGKLTLKSIFGKADIVTMLLAIGSKSSFLLNFKVYTKLQGTEDLIWAVRALAALAPDLATMERYRDVEEAWSQAFLYFITASSIPAQTRKEAASVLSEIYCRYPQRIGQVVVNGLWKWRRDIDNNEKDTAAVSARSGNDNLYLAVKSICPTPDEMKELGCTNGPGVMQDQLIHMLILSRPNLIPHASWIQLCLRAGVDPGNLVGSNSSRCLQEIKNATEYVGNDALAVHSAAYQAASDLAFVAPGTMIPLLVEQLSLDLDARQLIGIGPTEAAIYRTPEGTAYIDVLASQSQRSVAKNAKDYDTLKWEEELRAELAKKSGKARKLTADEQAKVNAQLMKESTIRSQISRTVSKLRRGIGIIRALATGPPTQEERWIVHAVELLSTVIEAGAGLIVGDAATLAYLDCARGVSPRLGPLRTFIGVATLRAIGVSQLPTEYLAESLQDQVTRVLYRIRFLGEQRPFDVVSLAYVLPLIFVVLEIGGLAELGSEEADEQLVLAIEFLSWHTGVCASESLPRGKLLSVLISSMQKYTQHYRILKDCLQDLCRTLEPTITKDEIAILLRGIIVPQVPVRNAVLQTIDAEIDLSDLGFSEEIWLACHDDDPDNAELAETIWEESGFADREESIAQSLIYLESSDRQLRNAAAKALAETTSRFMATFSKVVGDLIHLYNEKAKSREPQRDKFGMTMKTDLADPWEARSGVARALQELAPTFEPTELVNLVRFLIESGPLGDRNSVVRDEMIEATVAIITSKGASKVEKLMNIFETTLESPDRGSKIYDQVNEAVVILYGALARHLKPGDKRVSSVVGRLLATLTTPSETVQFAVAQCLPPLVQASLDQSQEYVQQLMDGLLQGKKYASRRGAAYGLAGVVRGKGISALRDFRIMSSLKGAAENKKDAGARQGAFLAFELLSLILGRMFEPYVIQIVPQLLAGFGDVNIDVREACLDASKTCFATLSSYGVKKVLPVLLEGLDDQQWRSKKGACDSLGAMAYLDPQQLALSLPAIIPPLTNVLNDSHKEVRNSAKRSLQRFGEVISNPEIKGVVDVLLKALSDPAKYTDEALDSLIKIQFVHFLDAPSLALVVRILERGLGDRSATKRKASQIIGSLAHLTERKDLISHLPILVAGLRMAIVDPVPATRATASKALGSTVEKLGEDALPDLIPNLMATLKSDTGAGDRLGSAQALSEVLAGLGTTRLEETLPTILQNVSSSKPSVREGFMSLFIFLPACFGNSFANYLNRIIPPILAGLADDVESIRDTALRAGRLLVKNFATRAIDLLLPELERGLADDSYRIRLSSVELVGDLLFNLTGISAKAEQDEAQEGAVEAGQSLLEVLGEEKRNKVLAALYICRCDTSGLVRSAAISVWKALVATPRTLREILPTLTQLLIRRLASPLMEQKVIAGNALGELIRKSGEGVLATLLPTLEEGLHTTDSDAKQGICIALRELINSANPEALEDYEKTLISVVRTALVDPDLEVREAAAEAFDSLQKILGKKAVDQVLPRLLSLLQTEDEAEHALAALLTLLTDATRSSIILPNLLPTLLKSPISSFNAKALASLTEVASAAMTRRLPHILNSLMDNIVDCRDNERLTDLNAAFDSVLVSVDEFDGLNTMMSAMLQLIKHDDHRRRRIADMHLAQFFSKAEIDISRYHPELIRALLIAFDDSDHAVVEAAWEALNALTKRLKKEEMESLVISTRQVLQQVGVAGSNLPGFALPKGINAILPIFLQGLMNGSPEQRTQAALAISDIIDRTSSESLRPFVTQITGPLIRVVSERSTEVKSAILFTLNNLLEKIPTFLRPFIPQLQRTFAKSLADTSSDVLRIRAAKALGTLITLTPRVDPLIAELVAGSKTSDPGVKNAMLKALYEMVSKVGDNMSDASRSSVLGLIDSDVSESDDTTMIALARLLGVLIKVLPDDAAAHLIKTRVLTSHFSHPSVLALNAILAESPESLTGPFADETSRIICEGIRSGQSFIADNSVLAAGKYLLTPTGNKSYEVSRTIFEALASVIPPGQSVDSRRLALVVVRTVSRQHDDLVRPHLALLAPPIFASVRDMVIPIKLAAEAAFLEIFSVVDEDSAVFDKYLAGAGAGAPAGLKRSMQDYFKRVVVRLAGQARERKEAEGGTGGLGLSNDELEDEREVWSVGRVDLGDAGFTNE